MSVLVPIVVPFKGFLCSGFTSQWRYLLSFITVFELYIFPFDVSQMK